MARLWRQRRRPIESRATSGVFTPRRVVRDGHVQTLLARRFPADSVAGRTEQPMLIDAGPDESGADPGQPVRLLGYYNPPLRPSSMHGLVVILHGWQGSSHSADSQFIAEELLRSGYATVRLNFRDHGPNIHFDRLSLNRGLFMGTLLGEVETAVRRVALLAGDRPLYIVGGSMGGNFSLRLAARHGVDPIPNLRRVVAICPPINPTSAMRAIDAQPAYRNFFRWRWLSTLRAKQVWFPETYEFGPLNRMRTVYEMTEYVVARYTPWKDADDYLARYGFGPEDAANLRVPATVIAAADDAVIPVEDFYKFPESANFHLHVHPVGGHMGFVDIFPYRRWLPTLVVRELREHLDSAA